MEIIDSSVDSDETGNKRLKLHHNEDRISDLPDSIIHHILSFLPSTKESIQTGILSKRWKNQWSCVSVLIFDFRDHEDEEASRWVDNILSVYDCSKIKKFHIVYAYGEDTNFTSKILFATRRNVEDLYLDYGVNIYRTDPYLLPESIFDNASLVELWISQCGFELSNSVNWPSLKVLRLDCNVLTDISGSIENVLSGSPSLESLELSYFDTENPVTIASKSLKILNFVDDIDITHDLEISCPNLEVLSCIVHHDHDGPPIFFPRKTLLNVLSGSSLLHSLVLNCIVVPLVIASKSLKKLVLEDAELCAIEISCPNLEVLDWCGSDFEKCKLINLPASCFASLDFVTPELEGCGGNLAKKILVELKRVKVLEVQNWFVKVLSALKIGEVPIPLLNVEYLTLDSPDFENLLGIQNAVRYSPMLEILVIKLHIYEKTTDLDLKFENSQIPEETFFNYHLNTVKIIGLSKKDIQCKTVLRFVAFLLMNARVLQRITVILKDGEKDFRLEVSRILSGMPRFSRRTIVELL